MHSDSALPLLGPAQVALIGRRVSIIVGSRDAAQRPHVMRAVGARLAADLRSVEVLMPQDSGAQVLDDVRANGQVAVVFSEPHSHLTVQLKGRDAVVRPAVESDRALAQDYHRGFAAEIAQLGFEDEVARTILHHGGELAVIRFTIEAAFEQTPGAAAGQPLAAGGALAGGAP